MPIGLLDEERLTEDIIALTEEFGRYGYRMITGMLNNSGWHVNHKRRVDLAAGRAESPTKTNQEGSAVAGPPFDGVDAPSRHRCAKVAVSKLAASRKRPWKRSAL